ncbi:unnamed protein product [Polarella glacialis]|uniref:Uncharacterized protein n=1 Tax=Polarella glacialis TaxID=89957 RepID=A0A813LPR8_POLGL|nr:unnamed protein product [Polarella glacialis]
MSGHLRIRRLWKPCCSSELTLSGVIVTIYDSTSYGPMFEKVPQQGPAGTHVSTYHATAGCLHALLAGLRGQPFDKYESMHQLLDDIKAVEPSSVVFNWEGCEDYRLQTFGGYRTVVLDLMKHILDKSHMIMCSDFSLNALLNDWSEPLLGPNPFIRLGEFSGRVRLHFDPEILAGCPSTQLRTVGELCGSGSVDVQCMPDTIAYAVDQSKTRSAAYQVAVLTHATNLDKFIDLRSEFPQVISTAGACKAAGHVMLHYPSGGIRLASAYHWSELVELDVSEERLIRVAESAHGKPYSAKLRAEISKCSSPESRSSMTKSLAKQFVESSSPCLHTPRRCKAEGVLEESAPVSPGSGLFSPVFEVEKVRNLERRPFAILGVSAKTLHLQSLETPSVMRVPSRSLHHQRPPTGIGVCPVARSQRPCPVARSLPL